MSDYIVRKRTELADALVREVCGQRYDSANLRSLDIPAQDAKRINDWIKEGKNFLVYLGSPGSGKTYLCAALIKYCWAKFESCRYWNERMFIQRLHGSIQENQDYVKSLEHMCDDEFVIFDDLGSTGLNDWRKEVIFEFLDKRYSSQKPTVITSNFTQEEIRKGLHPRVASRLFCKENVLIQMWNVDKRALEAPKNGLS